MSHNDDNTSMEFHCSHLGADGVAANFEGDWKKWGQIDIDSIRPFQTPELVYDTMVRGGLGFKPLTAIAQVQNPVTNAVTVLDRKAILNEQGEIIGIVGKDFNAMSHYDTLKEVFGRILEDGLVMARFINFDKGARMLAQFALPQKYWAVGREHKAFVTIYNGLDGTMRVKIGLTLWTPVCSNTFAYAMGDLEHKVKHTVNMAINLTNLSKTLGIIKGQAEESMGLFDQLGKVEVDTENVKEFVSFLMPKNPDVTSKHTENRRAELNSAIAKTQLETLTNVTLDNGTPVLPTATAYDLFAGVTRYIAEHQQSRNGNEQLEYVSFGPGNTLAQKALGYLTK